MCAFSVKEFFVVTGIQMHPMGAKMNERVSGRRVARVGALVKDGCDSWSQLSFVRGIPQKYDVLCVDVADF